VPLTLDSEDFSDSFDADGGQTDTPAVRKKNSNHTKEMEKPTKTVDETELVGGDSENKNWRGIVIALLVIIVICGLVVIAVILVTPRNSEEDIGEPFKFEDVYNLSVRRFHPKWMPGKNVMVYQSQEDGTLYEHDVDQNETRVIMESTLFDNLNVYDFSICDDMSYVLLAHDATPVYKHSYRARFTIFNRHSPDHSTRLIRFPQSDEMTEKLQFASWAPHGHGLTFIYGNNLYYQANPFTTPVRVADNKGSKYLLNGIADWLYEEEILHSSQAHWLSADGRFVAYMQFNDTGVPLETFPVYNDLTDIYGTVAEVSYPKAGDLRPDINPVVKLYIAETANVKASHRHIAAPRHLINSDHYITMVRWRDNTHVLVAWSNRAQNRTVLTLCHVISTDCQENLVEQQHEGKGWVFIEDVMFIRKGQQYLTILPQRIGTEGYWKHVALVSALMDSEGLRTYVTRGAWDVMSVVGVQEDLLAQYANELITIYFISTDGDPRKRHLFRIKLNVSTASHRPHVNSSPECLTCHLGDDCQYVDAQFSSTGEYYIEQCLGPAIPTYTLKRINSDSTVDTVDVMEDNAELKKKLSKKALPKKEYFQFETEDGQEILGQIYLPPILNKEHITLYPLLIHTYGGPDSQLVTEEFKLDWSTYLTSSENVIYASIDGRGSSARGSRFLHEVYRRLGTVEIQDQIAGANYLKKHLPFVDKDRIAFWGWSYGGFVVSHILGDKDDRTVRCGIAVAPVTDWRYYDTAYTERYMGFASSNDNYRAYDDSNVSAKAQNFRDKKFLLIHGTADDNVHFQNSAQLMKALTEENIMYDVQVYPDKNHNLAGRATTRHHYRTMTEFLQKECWGGGKPHEAKPLVAEMNQKQKAKS
jgi:dipeptidyl-peptidase-4